jgi:hypothetical protein
VSFVRFAHASISSKERQRKREKMVSHLCHFRFDKKKKIYHCGIWRFIMKKAILTGLTNTQRSLEDALFCNARLRTYEISKSTISENQHQNKTNQKQLLPFLSVSLLTAILLIVLTFQANEKIKRAQRI